MATLAAYWISDSSEFLKDHIHKATIQILNIKIMHATPYSREWNVLKMKAGLDF